VLWHSATIRRLRGITMHTLDREPKWRKRGKKLTTGATRGW
jgi:hydrogenase small subunit